MATRAARSAPATAVPVSARKAEHITSALKAEFAHGVYRAGEELSVVDLSARFGVSKQPVMDALRRLASSGFVEIVPQVGVRVASPDPTEVNDFYRISAVIEGEVSAMAAERRDHEGIALLTTTTHNYADAVERGDTDEITAAHRAAHRAIHTVANSRFALEMMEAAWDRSGFLRGLSMHELHVDHPSAEDDAQWLADHRMIAQAIIDGDTATAKAMTEQHVRRARDQVARGLPLDPG